jgi:hypothetical protein
MKPLFLIAIVVAALPGCATIISGSSDSVSFDSNPPGATVFVDDQKVGLTPCVAPVSRQWGYGDIRFALGGNELAAEVPRVVNGWYFGNLIFGGLIGLVVVDLPLGNLRKTPDGTTVFVDFSQMRVEPIQARREDEAPAP